MVVAGLKRSQSTQQKVRLMTLSNSKNQTLAISVLARIFFIILDVSFTF